MQKRIIRFLFLLCIVGLWGCQGSSLPLDKLPSSLILIKKRTSDGMFILEPTRQSIQTTDPIYQRLERLLKKEKTGWHRNFLLYTPGYYIFIGEHVIINCYSDIMIISIKKSGKYISFKKEIPNLLKILELPL